MSSGGVMFIKILQAAFFTQKSFRSQSYQTFFSLFFFFGIKLGHFTTNNFFCMLQKHKLTSKKQKNSSLA